MQLVFLSLQRFELNSVNVDFSTFSVRGIKTRGNERKTLMSLPHTVAHNLCPGRKATYPP